MLFERKERTYLGPMTDLEGNFEYLDRAARAEAEKVRIFLNQWVNEYPAAHREKLIARIRSGKDDTFESATFEVILFALLKSLGCSIEIEPDLCNGSTKHPDFLVVTPEGDSMYVEATLAFADSPAERAAEKRRNRIHAAIEKVHSPDFSINVSFAAQSMDAPNEAKLRQHIEGWLASLDPDAVFRQVLADPRHRGEVTEWRDKGWIIVLEAWGRPPERRGLGQRVVGLRQGNARVVNDWKPIRTAIDNKGSRYGVLPHPLLLAINVDAFWLDRMDEMQALFGQEEVVFNVTDRSATPTVRRKLDGVWLRKHTRVSGAWIFDGMTPWSVTKKRTTAYFNPWATMPLPPLFTRLSHARAVEDEMQWTEGLLPCEILGLSPEWP